MDGGAEEFIELTTAWGDLETATILEILRASGIAAKVIGSPARESPGEARSNAEQRILIRRREYFRASEIVQDHTDESGQRTLPVAHGPGRRTDRPLHPVVAPFIQDRGSRRGWE